MRIFRVLSPLVFFIVTLTLVTFVGCAQAAEEPPAPRRGGQSNSLKVTSFNIRWFGLGGSMEGNPSQEDRDTSIKDFLQRHAFPTDVIAFQEIVDVPRLQRLLPRGWSCVGYNHPSPKHQHVVLCASENYQFARVDYDNNFTIEDVAINPDKSRPAVRADLIERASKRAIYRIVAVHLKAYPEESDTRELQSRRIASDLARARDHLPTIVVGDFNTYRSDQTGEYVNDVDRIERALQDAPLDHEIRHIEHQALYTYRAGEFRNQFDQFYASRDVRVAGAPRVFGVCDADRHAFDYYFDPNYYYEKVSDHCPVTLTITR